jgi:hypothetical protein
VKRLLLAKSADDEIKKIGDVEVSIGIESKATREVKLGLEGRPIEEIRIREA